MDWTRSLGARLAALLAASVLLAVHWTDRGTWFWVGATLFVLNLVGLAYSRLNGSASDSGPPDLGREAMATTRAGEQQDGTEVILGHLDVPAIVAAFEEGPDDWVQVSYLDDEVLESVSWRFIAEYVWLEFDGQWSIGLGEEVKPYLDLDLHPDDDPVLSVLRTHPAIRDAWHEDREVYAVAQRAPLTVRDFGELAARALVAHHRSVRSKAS
jgi:hypothetical protein